MHFDFLPFWSCVGLGSMFGGMAGGDDPFSGVLRASFFPFHILSTTSFCRMCPQAYTFASRETDMIRDMMSCRGSWAAFIEGQEEKHRADVWKHAWWGPRVYVRS